MHELFENLMIDLPGDVLPTPDSISYYKLEKERKYYLDCEVDGALMSLHRMIMRWNIEDKGKKPEERKPIWIYIMSPGGEVDVMWSIVDAIHLSKTPVYTVNVGVASSAASLIFIAGHCRYMMPNAKVVIHEGSAQCSGDAIKVMDFSESYKKELKRMKQFILQHTGIPEKKLNAKRANDWELDATFCLENKVCEHIVESLEEVA